MVNVGTGSSGSAIVNKDYPCVEGLIAGTTKQEGTEENLKAENVRMPKGWGSL